MSSHEHLQRAWQSSRLVLDSAVLYANLLAAIDSASERIDFEYYIFELDIVGSDFLEALARAARRGVQVHVLLDGVGCAATAATIASELSNAGAQVRIYHPLPWLTGAYQWSLARGGWFTKWLSFVLNVNRRNHRKLCLVDARHAWIGSQNICREHLAVAAGGEGWRDYALHVSGAGVTALADAFTAHWESQPAHLQRGFLTHFLSNHSRRARRLKNAFVTNSVASATGYVWIVSAYFAPTARLRRSLLKAARSGADVRILLPANSDVAVFPGLSSHYYRELLLAGARVFQYQSGVLHAKAMLVDGVMILGSSNLNYRSTLHDLELDLVIRNPDAVAELQQVVASDMAGAKEVRGELLRRPSIISWLWYLLRYWM
ncbi:phosphatidylserine/phosphatidylglycerophosphate/cardiolipin synthase family protein [Halieaceae bacterium IMCC14734]|uniref:Phosphatidylserine/phosphatidylglycerophosphate/ cardiolipin synthase family protein n=1 Tax=Candidatus Litorirhabdus singularis TaxID=2518993 RepID=A0ABT3TBZ8_9GAMM|nr:phosphatidylserine/phosphatidylglycerophosphate/cardiolipin synthase family protein [Candidatus Litorirhabdus singularis]MCX2979796.1 phosphatidylserine/phosphatidylglycerophosphate/cardiolipin synthase family protein [Candidatus Litorirhabdus singularis]